MSEIKVVANGAGAAGIAIIKLYISMACVILLCAIQKAPFMKAPIRNESSESGSSEIYERRDKEGKPCRMLFKGADVFIGVSVAGALTREMVQS